MWKSAKGAIYMKPQVEAECQRITHMFLNDPCCKLFVEPVDPIRDEVPDYPKIVPNPQDLGTIYKRLFRRYYTYPSAWENDVNLVWDNAILFNGADSVIGDLAKSMKMKFAKKCWRLHLFIPKNWLDQVNILYAKINKLTHSPPPLLASDLIDKEPQCGIPPNEIRRFQEATKKLTQRNDILQLIQLLNMFGVQCDIYSNEPVVDIKSLPPPAAYTLMIYAKERFRSMNIPYPD